MDTAEGIMQLSTSQGPSVSQPMLLLLGLPRIERAGEPVEVDTRKALALLAYLAVTRQRHGRDVLATLLWPEYDQTHARGALRRTLSVLNSALASPCLSIERDSVALTVDAGATPCLSVDVEHFHALLRESTTHGHDPSDVCARCLPLLDEAVILYRDDFMAGFSLRDSPDFDEWQLFQAQSLRRECAATLERLVHGYGRQGAWQSAIQHARRWLALDPLHEPAHQALMQVYAWSGQRAMAVRQYHECERILERELGVPPLDETTRPFLAIKDNQLRAPTVPIEDRSTPVQSAATVSSESIAHPPSSTAASFVGRAGEWEKLFTAYRAIAGDGQFIVIEGEAGIGKTRLAEELLLHAQGASILQARCYAGETQLAYGPFVEALGGTLRQSPAPSWSTIIPVPAKQALVRLLPDYTAGSPDHLLDSSTETAGAQIRFFEGIKEVLLGACAGTVPGILFIDDLHWADTASHDLLTVSVQGVGISEGAETAAQCARTASAMNGSASRCCC